MGDLADRCQGRWQDILNHLGVSKQHLANRHGPCPVSGCGGTDRFRFDDKDGRGTFYCSHCGSGDGVKLAMLVTGLKFAEVARKIEVRLPGTVIAIPKATERGDKSWWLSSMWQAGRPLTGVDPASKHLTRRGVAILDWSSELRWLPRLAFTPNGGGAKSEHPAMPARMLGTDGRSFTVHATYLTNDGRKAALDPVRKVLGRVPLGGAVRLFDVAETLGIAEGVETALAASIIHGVPVWASLNDGNLSKWQPPAEVRRVMIFGDSDASSAGQLAAYFLARRLFQEGRSAEVLLAPRLPNDGKGTDWNDVLLSRVATEPASVQAAANDEDDEAILNRIFGQAPPEPEFEEFSE